MTAQPETPLDRLWLVETIRLREDHAGLLDDAEANRQARAAGGTLSEQIERRALFLAQRDGQLEAWRHWHQGARLAGLLLVLLALLSGAGLAFAALGDGQRPVNVFWALGSLLGLHLLTLLGWFLGFFALGDHGGALGRLWLWLSEKFARDARAVHLAPALLMLLQQRRLSRWLLGAGIHGLWLLAMGSALLTLLALLATRRYGFVWETTILGENAFVALTQTLGALPSLLGFAQPGAEQIRASGVLGEELEGARQAWAGWLVGVTLVYGVVPRLLLAAVCVWRWRRGRSALRLDPELPSYRLLRERLQPPSERLGIKDPAPSSLPHSSAGSLPEALGNALLVAIELDDTQAWPPTLPADVTDAGILDDRHQRRRLLEQLTRHPPSRLLIACDPRRSPDRGTLALIGELSRCARATRVWLLPPPPGNTLDPARLADWHEALERSGLAPAGPAPLQWLEHGDD
ncbi:DUF2868 domain-containing protein [Stutzerimonas tarimensis]|uniref:DUF2868 domain-containing protein n=1 Tax=Stutzerimonas tarimensis TaxID=1507735 RepID=A0ABV7T4P1_9GAMM